MPVSSEGKMLSRAGVEDGRSARLADERTTRLAEASSRAKLPDERTTRLAEASSRAVSKSVQ